MQDSPVLFLAPAARTEVLAADSVTPADLHPGLGTTVSDYTCNC